MTIFPITEAAPVQFPGPVPASADVVIVGGGIIGVTTALYLARKGLSAVVLEKGRVAAEQSSRNWGWIRQQGRDPAELPIMIEARRLWIELAAASGEDIGLQKCGVTYLARKDGEMEDFADFAKLAEGHGLASQVLDGDGAARLVPGMSRRFRGALHTPSDMRAEPWLAVPALARLAAREGVVIVENCAARVIDRTGGQVSGVWTERGFIRTDSVLVAGGAWSSLMLRRHGVTIPQLAVQATVAATEALPEFLPGAATDEHIAFRRRQDGGYTLAAGGRARLFIGPDAFRHMFKYMPALRENPFGVSYAPAAPRGWPDAWTTQRKWEADAASPFEALRILNPAPQPSALRAMARRFQALFPQAGEVRLKTTWAGMIDAMPDVVPVVDRVAAVPGLFVATGMSGHGFGIGPGIGRVMADLISGNASGYDLSRFRLARFSDGSPMRPGPAI